MKNLNHKSRLDLVRDGIGHTTSTKRHGRFIVSLDKIVEDPRNERKTYRAMDGLIASVKANGIIEPLTVTWEPDGAYRIITGHRRFRAAKAAGLNEIEVLIRDPEAETVRRRKSVISNVQREDIGPVEMAEALQALLDEDESITSQKQLADAIGKDKRWVSDMLGVLKLPAEQQSKVRTSRLSIAYDSMIKIARLTDRSLQERLINDVLDRASVHDIRRTIRAATGASPTDVGGSKPKRVFHTKQDASVIVQSKRQELTLPQIRRALEEAVDQATSMQGDA